MKKHFEHGGFCGRFANVDGSCRTCESLAEHEEIYGGLSQKESLALYKKRTAIAFGVGLK